MSNVICPYCGSTANVTSDSSVYGRHYGYIYLCSNYPRCDAYVGIHKGTWEPKGTMANAELRKWRLKAHTAFDPLWTSGCVKRKKAYKWLADRLKIPVDECHIGMFDIEMCKKVVQIMEE